MAPGGCLACGSKAGAASPSRVAVRGRRLPKRLGREQLEELSEQTKLTQKEVRALYSRFRRLAPNGFLDKEQFRNTMGVIGLTDDTFLPDRMFKIFDVDGDEKLSFREFATSLAVMIRGSEEEKLKLSFDMTAGERGAPGISLDDFHRLINACNSMMSSLVAPSHGPSTKEDVDRLFHELSSGDEGGHFFSSGGGLGRESSSDGETDHQLITWESYKAAAQGDELFLQCLGLKPNTTMHGRRSPVNTAGAKNRAALLNSIANGMPPALSPSPAPSVAPSAAGTSVATATAPVPLFASGGSASSCLANLASAPAPAAGGPPPPPGCTVVSQAQLEELRERVARVNAMLQGDSNCLALVRGNSPSAPSRCRSPSLASQDAPVEDLDERWWTPLPPRRQEPGQAVLDEVCAELDRVLGWCSAAEAGSPTAAATASQGLTPWPQFDYDRGCRTPTRRDISREPSIGGDISGLRKSNVHKPTSKVALDPTIPPISDGSAAAIMGSRESSDENKVAGQQPSSRTHRSQSFSQHRRRHKKHRLLGPKKGLAVHFGHENWNMVLSMMVGIRLAVGRSKHEMARELQPCDFYMKEKFSIIPRMANIFDSSVSKRVTMTRFIDYAPMVFQRIRQSFGIHHDDYLRSVGPEQLLGNMVLGNLSSLSELSSEGKSGAFFYYTADGNYMLKTVTPKEYQLLKGMLKSYHDHIFNNTGTLLVRFLGLHCLSVRKTRKGPLAPCAKSITKLYFVVMANMFNTPFEIHRRYDLKGSWVGRQTPPEKYDPGVALKDVDFQNANECIRVGEERKAQIVKQLEADSAFLASQNIIDYSLLLGIHETSGPSAKQGSDDEGDQASDYGGVQKMVQVSSVASSMVLQTDSTSDLMAHMSAGAQPTLKEASSNISGSLKRSVYSGAAAAAGAASATAQWPGSPMSTRTNMGEAPIHRRDSGGMLSQDKRSLYFLGVIDILTPYDTIKVLEHRFKGLRYDPQGVSCCPPTMYAERFNKFMRGAFA